MLLRHTGHGACRIETAALAFRSVGSGVIYAVLVLLWGVYFIPRWLRRHEELSEARSVEKFDQAMRVLSRQDPLPSATVPAQRGASSARRGLRTTSPLAIRRRRVLAALLLTTALMAPLTPVTALAWWAPLLGLVAVVGYLVHCRLQARSRLDVSRTRKDVRSRSRSRLLRFDAIERLMAVRREMAADRAAEAARWEEAEVAMEQMRDDEERSEAGWNPVPVPLPTYVTKPAAPRRTAEPAPAQAAEPVRPAPTAAPMSRLLDDADDADSLLDDILSRRAVND